MFDMNRKTGYCEHCGRSERPLGTICMILGDLLQKGFTESQCLQVMFVMQQHMNITRKDLETMEQIIRRAIEMQSESADKG